MIRHFTIPFLWECIKSWSAASALLSVYAPLLQTQTKWLSHERSNRRTDRRMNRWHCYQLHHLPASLSYAVDKNKSLQCNNISVLPWHSINMALYLSLRSSAHTMRVVRSKWRAINDRIVSFVKQMSETSCKLPCQASLLKWPAFLDFLWSPIQLISPWGLRLWC